MQTFIAYYYMKMKTASDINLPHSFKTCVKVIKMTICVTDFYQG